MPKFSFYILALALIAALTCRANNPFSPGQEFSSPAEAAEGKSLAQNSVPSADELLSLFEEFSGQHSSIVGESDEISQGADYDLRRPPFAIDSPENADLHMHVPPSSDDTNH